MLLRLGSLTLSKRGPTDSSYFCLCRSPRADLCYATHSHLANLRTSSAEPFRPEGVPPRYFVSGGGRGNLLLD